MPQKTPHIPADQLTDAQVTQLVELITREYASGQSTIGMCCAKYGYTEKDFMLWMARDVKPFPRRRLMKMAMYEGDQRYLSDVKIKARQALLNGLDDRLIEEKEQVAQLKNGYYINEDGAICNKKGQVVTEPEAYIIKQVVKTKLIKADTQLVKFALLNTDPFNFKDKTKEAEQKAKQMKLEFGEKG